MEANDLMIGDWVLINTYPEKVKLIGETLIKVWNRDDSIDVDDVSPIPLTTEILEKNGFKKIQIHGEKQDDIFQCYDGEITIEVGIYDPNYILIHYRYETPDGINSGELSSIIKVDGGKFYLHELQHALRLCGIEKEIIL